MVNESKRIVLTGATRGLGRALVPGFAKRGHTVIGCGTNPDAVAQISEAFPGPHDFSVVDVTDRSRVAEWAAEVLAQHGPPDLLINNAGVINRNAPMWQVPAEEFDRVVDVNVKGVANCIRMFLPAMIEQGRGVVVNLSSGWGRSTSPEVAPYCATKWAIEGLTRALAEELPAPLAAIPVSPGPVNTDMLQSCFGSLASGHRGPEEWAEEAVPFLLKLDRDDNGEPLTTP